MKSFGVNVPDGQPAHTVEEVARIAPLMADEKGEVRRELRKKAARAAGPGRKEASLTPKNPNQKPPNTHKTEKHRSSSSPRSSRAAAASAPSPTA